MGPLLERHFASGRISYLVIDPQTRKVLLRRWQDPHKPIPLGSLVKPFAALSYAATHSFRYPELDCDGERMGCWRVRGHGRVDLPQAIAHSCNAYFLELTRGLLFEQVKAVTVAFRLPAPPTNDETRTYLGFGEQWKIAPASMASAYAELVDRSEDPGVGDVLAGLVLAAQQGTAAGIRREISDTGALAKTGTAPCVHRRRAPGDGYVMALAPADKPRYGLLLQVHGVPGRKAADLAGKMLRLLLEGE